MLTRFVLTALTLAAFCAGASDKCCRCCCGQAPVEASATVSADQAEGSENPELKLAIAQLGSSSWQDAQDKLIAAGKAAIPLLIENVSNSETAYNLGGHTKADAGRGPRQRTVGDVCSELLASIVLEHSNYSGEVPGFDKNAWIAWWDKNGGSLVFAVQ